MEFIKEAKIGNKIYRYSIYEYEGAISVWEQVSYNNGFTFDTVADWDGFQTREDAIRAIEEDISQKQEYLAYQEAMDMIKE